MGEWKTQMNLRVMPDFRRNFEAFAEKERRKPGNLACALLEWAFEQLQTAGSLTNLLKYHLGKKRQKVASDEWREKTRHCVKERV